MAHANPAPAGGQPADGSGAERTVAFLWIIVAYLSALVAALVTGIAVSDWHPIGVALAADLAATGVVFAFSFWFDNSSFYDPYWSVAPLPIALYWALAPGAETAVPARQGLALVVVALWGLRLTSNWARGWRGLDHEDWRYVDLRRKSGGAYWAVSFGGLHFGPTLIVFLGCLPLWAAVHAASRPLGLLDAAGVALALGGTLLELLADAQLQRFRLAPPAPDAVLESGLWAWSRHPNYLGEILYWCGLALLGFAAAGWHWWIPLGALAMALMFWRASLPLMEERMLARRPRFADVQRRVPLLIPRPPKRR
jgi:steroid 5-alpha reductase family enzyme